MNRPHLFLVPYDSGAYNVRMGAGPLRLRELLSELPAQEIVSRDLFPAEIKTTFELYRSLADAVREAGRSAFPIVLAGNCGAVSGLASGIGAEGLGVIWFDAHGDFMTPETTATGFLDAQAISILTGRCWTTLAASIPNFAPVPIEHVIHIGGRDHNEGERDTMTAAGLALVEPPLRDAELIVALDAFKPRVTRLLVHVDLDVIDPAFGTANGYAAPGGLSPDDVIRAIRICSERFPIAALELASFDPAYDTDGRIAAAAARIVEQGSAGRRFHRERCQSTG
ncbi:MAG TPA: arginase family protein [Thermoanaerobaculia bacterium]|nr:arginase family protein [Thermoanaerobaculia bacterium]